MDRNVPRLVPALILMILGVSAWASACVLGCRLEGFVFPRLLLGLAAIVAGAFAWFLAVGFLRRVYFMRKLTAASAIVTVIAGSVLAAILGQVVPDLFDNPRLALPGTAAILLTVAVFLVLLPGYVAFAVARPLLDDERSGAASGPSLIVFVGAVASGAFALWAILFAIAGLPFAVPGMGLASLPSRMAWAVLAVLSVVAARGLYRAGGVAWRLAVGISLYLLVSGVSAILAGGVDWLDLFSRDEQMRIVGYREPVERGVMALVFFSSLIHASFLLYYRDRFTNTPR